MRAQITKNTGAPFYGTQCRCWSL